MKAITQTLCLFSIVAWMMNVCAGDLSQALDFKQFEKRRSVSGVAVAMGETTSVLTTLQMQNVLEDIRCLDSTRAYRYDLMKSIFDTDVPHTVIECIMGRTSVFSNTLTCVIAGGKAGVLYQDGFHRETRSAVVVLDCAEAGKAQELKRLLPDYTYFSHGRGSWRHVYAYVIIYAEKAGNKAYCLDWPVIWLRERLDFTADPTESVDGTEQSRKAYACFVEAIRPLIGTIHALRNPQENTRNVNRKLN